MAESDPVKRLKAAARRADSQTSVENQHRWYMEDLEGTIGRDPSGTWDSRAAKSEPRNWFALTVLLTLIGAVVVVATLTVLLWRNGTFDDWLSANAPGRRAAAAPKWILGDQETGRPSPVPTGMAPKSDAPPNQIEPVPRPAAPPPAAEPEPEPEAEVGTDPAE